MSFQNPPTWKSTVAFFVGGFALAFLLAYSQSTSMAIVDDGKVYLQCDALTESSGLAASTRNDQVVWSHNDSGDSARVFAFDLQGRHLAQVMLPGITAVDWEDMCAFEFGGEHYLAVADVGDNFRRRSSVAIHIFKEPDLSASVTQTTGDAPSTAKRSANSGPLIIEAPRPITLELTYAEGAVDCEAIAYHPIRRSLQLFTKEMLQSRIYNISLDQMKSAKVTLKAEQALDAGIVTGGDISRDGQSLALVSYGPYWLAEAGSDGKWNAQNMRVFDSPERQQGESICFSADGGKLLFSSEHAPTPLLECSAPSDDSSPDRSSKLNSERKN